MSPMLIGVDVHSTCLTFVFTIVQNTAITRLSMDLVNVECIVHFICDTLHKRMKGKNNAT